MDQVVCKRSNAASDVRCSICGQGFLVYGLGLSRSEKETSRRQIQEVLREHHAQSLTEGEACEAHPKDEFAVPGWASSAAYSVATPQTGDGVPGV